MQNHSLKLKKKKDEGKILHFALQFSIFSFALLIWLAPLGVFAATVGKPANYLLQSGLVGWWTFDGADMGPNVRDRSGSGNHGNLIGQTSTTTAIGKLGQALSFDGVNDYVNLGTNSLYNFTTSDFSVSFWVNPKSLTNEPLLLTRGLFNNDGWYIQIESNKLKLKTSQAASSQTAQTTNSISLDTWTYVTVVRNGSTARIYLNGVDNTSGSPSITDPLTSARTLYIARYDNSSAYNLKGFLDDVRIYNRALSATEIKSLYNSASIKYNTSAITGSSLNEGLVGHWTFDGADMGPNVRDRSGSGNHGNLIGQTSTTTSPGKIGQALSFDGVNDYQNVIDTSSLNLSSGNFAIGFWIKQKSGGASTQGLIDFGYQCGNNSRELVIFTSASSRVITARMSHDGMSTNLTPLVSSAGIYDLNKWTHLMLTSDSSELKLYANGGLVTTQGKLQASFFNSSTAIRIGQTNCGDTESFVGSIDDVRIYNRALSATEIKSLYNSASIKYNTSAITGSSLNEGLVGHWTFDGVDMGPNVRDRSGSGNHGNLIGQTSTTTAPGKLGQALSFDGVNDFVSAPSISGISVENSYTTSLWVRATASSTASDSIIESYVGSSNRPILIFWQGSANELRAGSYDGTWQDPKSGPMSTGVWHHVVLVHTPTPSHVLYIDGVVQVGTTNPTSISVSGTNIGGGDTTRVRSFLGSLDDIRIYNRALSASEVTQLYNLGR